MVDLLVRDTEGQPGALPLLSHALAETWRRRDGRVLTVAGYRATGEIHGAVARSADRLYESLPAEQRQKLRSVLLRLVSQSADGEPVRSRVATSTLGGDSDRERVLGLLVRARLVTSEEDTVELAHEALARAWPRLRSWLDEDAAGHRMLRHLAAAADGWESLGRPATELYRGARLEAVLEWQGGDGTGSHPAGGGVPRGVRRRSRLRASAAGRSNPCAGAPEPSAAALPRGCRRPAGRGDRRGSPRLPAAPDGQAARNAKSALTALVSNAAALRANRRDLAALLAVEAHRMAPSAATESALFGTFTASPGAVRTVHTDLDQHWWCRLRRRHGHGGRDRPARGRPSGRPGHRWATPVGRPCRTRKR